MSNPTVFDVRPDNAPSLSVVPRMGPDDFEALQSIFHFQVNRSKGEERAQNGQSYWRLTGLELREGIAAYIPQVKKPDGTPAPNILVYRHWPGAPELPGGITPDPDYFGDGAGVAGFTDEAGVIGWGYSGESAFGPNGGPDSIWVSADPPGGPRRHSDMLDKNGWHGGTDHLTVNPIFTETVKDDGITPPDPEPDPNSSLVQLFIDGIERYRGRISSSGLTVTDLPIADAPHIAALMAHDVLWPRGLEMIQTKEAAAAEDYQEGLTDKVKGILKSKK